MTATRGGNGFRRSAGDAALRGALLVAAAVILGVLLIWRGHSGKSDTVSTAGSTTSTTQRTAGATTTSTTRKGQTTLAPTTVPPASIREKARVRVVVANGVGTSKPGYASQVKTKLVSLTWAVQGAYDAKPGQPATQIFYVDGYLEEAKALARDLGADVAPTLLPNNLTTYLNADAINAAQAANIVVILGLDDKVKVT
jgi:hypothetical protein